MLAHNNQRVELQPVTSRRVGTLPRNVYRTNTCSREEIDYLYAVRTLTTSAIIDRASGKHSKVYLGVVCSSVNYSVTTLNALTPSARVTPRLDLVRVQSGPLSCGLILQSSVLGIVAS
jgi:hypothetical protein